MFQTAGIVAARNGGKNIFGEKLKVPTITTPARTAGVVTPGLNRHRALYDLNRSLIPEQLLNKIENFDFNKEESSKSSADRAATAAIEEDIREKLKEMEFEAEEAEEENHLHLPQTTADRGADYLRRSSDSSFTVYDYLTDSYVESHSQPVLAVFRDHSLNALKTGWLAALRIQVYIIHAVGILFKYKVWYTLSYIHTYIHF